MKRIGWMAAALTALTMFGPVSAAHAGGVATGADLQISGSASTGSPDPGTAFSYTFQVKTSGPDTATAVGFTDPVPAGMTFNYATANGSIFPCGTTTDAQGGTVVSCALGTLAKGAQAVVVVNLKAPIASGTYSNTGTTASAVSDPQPANNSVTVNIQVKAVTCSLPAGQPTLTGMVMYGSPDSSGVMNSFGFQANGVNYVVLPNYFDGSAPLTSVINLACQLSPAQFVQVGEFVNITGIVTTAVLPGSTTATNVIYPSVIQVPFFKDKI